MRNEKYNGQKFIISCISACKLFVINPFWATLQKEFLKFRNSFCIISKLQD